MMSKTASELAILFLAPEDTLRVKAMVGLRRQLISAPSFASLASILERNPFGALICDPKYLDLESGDSVIRTLVAHAGGVLIYTGLDRASVSHTLSVAAMGLCEVVEHGAEEAIFAARLANLPRKSVAGRILRGLTSAVARLPIPLWSRVLSPFAGGPISEDLASDFAIAANVSRRSILRWLGHANLTSPVQMSICAYVARTWEPLTEQRRAITLVANDLGYDSMRTFRRHFVGVVGLGAQQAITELDDVQFAARVVRKLTTSSGMAQD